MANYILYSEDDGKITNLFYNQDIPAIVDTIAEGLTALELTVPFDEAVGLTHYVVGGGLVERPVATVVASSNTIDADGSDTITISGLPSPSNVAVIGPLSERFEYEGDELEIDTNIPGEYTVIIQSFPYQDIKVQFDAV